MSKEVVWCHPPPAVASPATQTGCPPILVLSRIVVTRIRQHSETESDDAGASRVPVPASGLADRQQRMGTVAPPHAHRVPRVQPHGRRRCEPRQSKGPLGGRTERHRTGFGHVEMGCFTPPLVGVTVEKQACFCFLFRGPGPSDPARARPLTERSKTLGLTVCQCTRLFLRSA